MQCPRDAVPLAMSDRQGIEIDYCPTCRGIWLDRSELDKIIERSGFDSTRGADSDADARSRHGRDEPEAGRRTTPKKKRDGFLGNLFDLGVGG